MVDEVESEAEELNELEGLTARQKAFIDEYLVCWSGAEAARRAGYKGNSQNLSNRAYVNLRNPVIAAIVKRRMEERTMAAEEVLARIDEIARGNIGDYLAPAGRGFRIDVKKALKSDRTHLIRSLKKGKNGVEIELYSAMDALGLLGKHYKLFTDVIQQEMKLNTEGLDALREKIYGKDGNDTG